MRPAALAPTPLRVPSQLAELLALDCVVQMESTIPAGLTIAEWRRAQARQRVESRRGRRRRRVRGWGR